jgi:hypothetical protein
MAARPTISFFDFDEEPGRSRCGVSDTIRARYDITLQNAAEFLSVSRHIGGHFTPMGVIQGWSAESMASAAKSLVAMGYDYLAIGGTVPLDSAAMACVRSNS